MLLAANRPKPKLIQFPQRSEEWFKARLGLVTGSNAYKTLSYYAPTVADLKQATEIYIDNGFEQDDIDWLLDLSKTEFCLRVGIELREATERKSYRQGIVAERLTGLPADPDPYVTYDMKWGSVNEDIAKTLYQMEKQCLVEDAYLAVHPELKCGASTDGTSTDMRTGEIGNCEVKCLRTANHLYKIIKENAVPDDYRDQIQFQMWLTGFDWCDFIGFDSRVPEGLKIYVERIPYDPLYLDLVLLPAIERFLKECENDFKHFWAMVKNPEEAQAKISEGQAIK
jgi:hypothetical protein